MQPSNLAVDGIVVGGAGGVLGKEVVEHLLAAGYRVHAIYRERSAWPEHPALTTHCCNLSDGDAVQELVTHLTERHGGIGAVINAAGGFVWTKTVDCSSEHFNFLLDANFKTSFFLVKATLPRLCERQQGRIVLISAAAALHGGGIGMGVYSASKSALNALLKSTAAELHGSGVTINAICPTIIDSPRNRSEMPTADFSKWVTTATINQTIDLLLSKTAAVLNGVFIPLG